MGSKSMRRRELASILSRTGAKVVKSRRRKYDSPGSPTKHKRRGAKKSIKKMRMSMRRSSKCQKLLSNKIGINMAEYKKGRYSSPKQAIAVAYSQVRTKHPSCRGSISKSRKSRRPAKKSNSKKTRKSVRR